MSSNQDPRSSGGAHSDAAEGSTSVASGTGRRVQILAGIVAAALLTGFVTAHTIRSKSAERLATETMAHATAPPLVDVATVQSPSPTDGLTLPGEAAAWFESTTHARVDGYVGKWFVDIGDQVQEGQVLATIETPELDAQLSAAQARLRAAEAEVEVRKTQLGFTRSTYDRWNDSPKGVVSEQEREDKRAAYDSAQSRLSAAVAQINFAQADVDRLMASEQFKQVRAPFTGTIVQRRIDIGDLVTAGSTTGHTPLYRMTKNDPIRIFVQAPQSVAASMKIGTPVHVSVRDLQGRTFDGTITRTANAVDTNARTLRVEIDLPNADGALVPGSYVQATFDLRAQGLAQVPAAALVFRTSGPQVAVLGDDGAVAFRNVAIARDNGSVVDLASGAHPGEQVVLNISSQIADGEKVRVSQPAEEVAAGTAPAAQ